MAGVKDVAARAGVSIGTVSNVINHPEAVSEEMRARVLKAMDELAFVPKSAAWHLRANRRPIIGLVVPNISNPFFTEVACGVEEAAFASGYAVHLCHSDYNPDREDEHLRVLESQHVSAVLVTPIRESLEPLQRLLAHGVSVTLLGRDAHSGNVCSVSVDDRQGGYAAGRHVLALGHTRLLWLAGSDSVPVVSDREIGFMQAVREARAVNPLVAVDRAAPDVATTTAGDETITRLLLHDFPYTAIVCANDLLALGAMRALARIGIDVPGDVSIVVYDDLDYAGSAMVPLTSVRQPMQDLGSEAVRLALQERHEASAHTHQHIVFQPKLIQRASTARPRGDVVE